MKIKEIYVRWISIPVVALVMVFLFADMDNHNHTFIQKFFISLFFVAFFWNGAFMIFIFFRKKYPQIRQTPKRLLVTMLTLSAFLLIGDFAGCGFIHQIIFQEPFSLSHILVYAPINFGASFVIGSVYENVYFFEQWKNTIQMNEALKNQQIRTQFEVLQNQMSPHFLFNSLNTLTTLIAEDQQTGIEFTQKLSEVYRYILQNKEKDLVTLCEEIEFAKAYSYLLQMRYPENLQVNFNVDKTYMHEHIAPLTIQMLIENAIKHNIISKSRPLSVEVYVENGKSIIVKNNLQKKRVIEKSTKTGLENIQKRYAYFGMRNIDIITSAKNYIVAIPLIKVVNNTNHYIPVQ